jgi:alpha-tubulin suppressor-like RCC1 family protein
MSIVFYCSQVKDVSCGRHHTVALSLLGEVFTFGAGDEGQLGNGSRADERTPRRVEGHLRGKTVTQVATGKHHTIVLEEASGKILGFGCAKNGVLGRAGRLEGETHRALTKNE